jgi:hypothetical protein
VKKVISLFQSPASEQELLFTLNRLVGQAEYQPVMRELVDLGLIEKIAPLLGRSTRTGELSSLLIELFGDAADGRQRVSAFAESNGIVSLITLTRDSKKKVIAYQIIEIIQNLLTPDASLQLLSIVLENGRYDVAAVLVEQAGKSCLTTLGSFIKKITEALKKKEKADRCSRILQFYLNNTNSLDDFIQSVTLEDVIQIGSVSLMRNLIALPAFLALFKNKDAIMIATQIKNGTDDQKLCAMLFALGLSADFFSIFAQYPQFVNICLEVKDHELAYRFLVRLCRFPQCCEILLQKSSLLNKNFKNPWILTALSRAAGFYPSAVLKLSFLKEKLLRNLEGMVQLEASLRLLGVFSTTKSFWEDGTFVKALFTILGSCAATPIEMQLLLAVLSNVAAFISMKDQFLRLLTIAEAGGTFAGVAMRILGQNDLPTKQSRDLTRLLAMLKYEIANGDSTAVAAASKIIEKSSLNKELRTLMTEGLQLDRLVVDSAIKQTDPFTFIALMSALDKLEVTVTSQILSLFDQMAMKSGITFQSTAEFVELRSGLSRKLKVAS